MFVSTLLNRRRFLYGSTLALGATVSACVAPIQAPLPVEAPVQNPQEALERLLAGNQRYAANGSLPVNESSQRRTEVAQGQQPFATIFCCVDSRVPPELVFDRGLGDLFVIRTAGHVIDEAVLGSLEFGVVELQIPLLMVLGHAKCGAVTAALEAVEHNTEAPASIGYLVKGIKPALELAAKQPGDALDNAVKANVALTVKRLQETPLLAEAVVQGQLLIVGARYNLESGSVELIEG
jgi:carbonic anhydrase